ncbi:MAG TPA: hypothetical protein VJN90_00435 [Candidatus Acidoferrales bacterium]|nr:hypothetical protein [Candidatus Acidoferrales bacterium]
MTNAFDIFEVEPSGSVMWRGTAAAFEEAKLLVQKLAKSRAGEYIIFSLKTGKKVVLKSDGSAAGQETSGT